MSNLTDKISGKAKEVAGKVTDDKKLEVEGKVQQGAADAKQKASDVADKLSGKHDEAKHDK